MKDQVLRIDPRARIYQSPKDQLWRVVYHTKDGAEHETSGSRAVRWVWDEAKRALSVGALFTHQVADASQEPRETGHETIAVSNGRPLRDKLVDVIELLLVEASKDNPEFSVDRLRKLARDILSIL